jgi:diguanylate cyclase (GGDEF)-like protein
VSTTLVYIAIGVFFTLIFFIFLLRDSRRLYHLRSQVDSLNGQLQDEQVKEKEFSSEIHRIKAELDHSILYDSLTGLPSRQLLEDRLLQTVNQSQRYKLIFGVLFLDISRFKVVNSALGYDAGDELLKQIAVRLQSSLRQVDTVCRFAADEFVMILPQVGKAETCAYIAQRLLDAASQPFTVLEQELFVTACIGIAVYPSDGEDGKTLLKNADAALHRAKSRGNSAYQFFQKEMQTLSQRELALNVSLRHTTIYNEFSIFYQPQVDIKTKKIICMEALLRWQHPEFGLVAPREFLQLAENSGKIIEIGEHVLRTVCQQFKKWRTMNLNLTKVSVNISLRQLENPHFIYKLSQILNETNMAASSLVLEISEGVFHRLDLFEKTMNMLKHLGVQIAIDDFGTGHLSMQQIKSFSIDYLKIDGSLVQDITINQESEALTKMIISFAQTLRYTVIAEGVETKDQKESLERLGCVVMQGHLFSLPRKPEEFTLSLEKAICEA